jgi:tellurite resistance protein
MQLSENTRSRPPVGFTVSARPGPRTLDSLITVAAEMALADGEAHPAEHLGLLAFLRQDDTLARLGRRATLDRFAAALDGVAARRATGVHDAPDLAETLRPLAGSHAARLVARAAAHVAAADGTLHPGELALLRSLHATLGLTRGLTRVGQPA